MSQKYKLALFGAGRIGKIHAATVAANPNCKLEAVVDIYEPAAKNIASKYGAKIATAEEVFDNKEITAVLICSATNTHADLIEIAAKSKKAIFCEKPIDLNLDRVKACLQIVKDNNTQLFLGFNRRFDNNFQALKKSLDAGDIGEAEIITISSRDPAPPPIDYIKTSGGLFKDMMIHDFDMACWLKEELPIKLSAHASCLVDKDIAKVGDVDTAIVNLEFADGGLAVITNSRRASYGYDQRIEVHGSKGMLEARNVLENTVVKATKFGSARANPKYFFLERYQQAYATELDSFIQCIVDKKEPEVSGIDGQKALVLAEAAIKSLATGKTIVL